MQCYSKVLFCFLSLYFCAITDTSSLYGTPVLLTVQNLQALTNKQCAYAFADEKDYNVIAQIVATHAILFKFQSMKPGFSIIIINRYIEFKAKLSIYQLNLFTTEKN